MFKEVLPLHLLEAAVHFSYLGRLSLLHAVFRYLLLIVPLPVLVHLLECYQVLGVGFRVRINDVHYILLAYAVVPLDVLARLQRGLVSAAVHLVGWLADQHPGEEQGVAFFIGRLSAEPGARTVAGLDCKVVAFAVSTVLSEAHIEALFPIADGVGFDLPEAMPQQLFLRNPSQFNS